jgi:protocatechuate 3,4-dioxygenase beta subunit
MSSRVPTMLVAATTLLVIASALAAQPAAAQGTSSLSGQVCEATQVYYIMKPEEGDGKACGYPLAGATVTLKPTGTLGSIPATARTATTDADGRYQAANLADGDYTVEVARAGFETLAGTAKVQGATTEDWLLEGKMVTLSGTVRGTGGEPVKAALVSACCTDRSAETRTDAEGKYKLEVRGGHRDVYVRDAPGYAEAYQHVLVDGQAPVDFKLDRLPPQDAAVAGTVRDADGKPLAGIRVSVQGYGAVPEPRPMSPDEPASSSPDYARGHHNWTTTGADGRYRIGTYGGQEVHVSIHEEGYVPHGHSLFLAKGETGSHDVVLKKYPAKDARLVGRVVDAQTGEPVRHLSIYVQNRPYGQSEWSCDDGAVAADAPAREGGGSAGSGASTMPAYAPSCAIQVGADGTFEASLMPGATSVSVSHQSWRLCPDGRCEVSYYSWTGMVVLRSREQTELTVELVARPQPDATVQGYVLDAESGQGIANATVWFSSQDSYGHGTAQTDADGSYRIRLRQGYHSFGIQAPGHHAWEGVVMVGEGTTDLDVRVQAGEDAGGWCCGRPMPLMAESASYDKAAAGPAPAAAGGMAAARDERSSEGQAVAYQDLGGKLGPYDASKRAHAQDGGSTLSDSRGSPAPALALLAVLVLGLAARRRRA